jgi:hypothetical protein
MTARAHVGVGVVLLALAGLVVCLEAWQTLRLLGLVAGWFVGLVG